MERNRFYILVSLLFGVFSLINCQTIEIAGRYIENRYYGSMNDLSLNKDGSFQYILKEGIACDTIFGEWEILKNKRVLITPIRIKNYHIESNCNTCVEAVHFATYALPDNYELDEPGVKIYARGEVIDEGITSTVNNEMMQKADSVLIQYFGFMPYVFVPQKRKNAIIKVFLIEEQQELLQRTRIFKIKRSKIVTEKGIVLNKQQ